MKIGGGKRKGSGFERTVSRLLDVWWGVPDSTFWRTTNSGGWKEPGDIAPRLRQGQKPVWFPFVVECKFVRNVDVLQLLENLRKSTVFKWWKQVSKEKEQAVKLGRNKDECKKLLIFKRNRSSIFVMFDRKEIPFEFSGIALQIGSSLCIVKWKDFIGVVTKNDVYEQYGKPL